MFMDRIINIVKMAVILKLAYRFNVVTITFPAGLFFFFFPQKWTADPKILYRSTMNQKNPLKSVLIRI